MSAMTETVAAAELKRRKVTKKVFISERLDERQKLLVNAILSWRYGVTTQVQTVDEASIVVVADDKDSAYNQLSDKLLLPGYDLRLLKRIADNYLQVQKRAPTLLVPFGDDWLISKLAAKGYSVVTCDELEQLADQFVRANDQQKASIKSQIFSTMLQYFGHVDYSVVLPERFPIHLALAVYSKAFNKPVIAEASSPLIVAIVDFAVPRREDLLGVVDAITAHGDS